MDGGDMETGWLTTKQKADEEHVTKKTVLRRRRDGRYPGARQVSPRGKWLFPHKGDPAAAPKGVTDQEIVIQEERKQAVLKHHKMLRAVVGRWKSQVWLPPPWRWDLANLEYVFYLDTKKQAKGEGATGYKLPSDLVDSAESKEESRGHFRHYDEGDVRWEARKDGAVILKLGVESDDSWSHLEAHTQEVPAWTLFAEWKKKGGTYIQLCSSLLARIDQDARKATGVKSALFSWVIYHDVFCIKATDLRCDGCGRANSIDSRQCQGCGLPLGWLRSISRGYERGTKDKGSSPVHIHGWGNIEETVEAARFEGMKRGHLALIDKYRGHDLVDTILEREREVQQVQTELVQELESLSKQGVYPGRCSGCTRSDQS